MLIEMHAHTSEHSSCSTVSALDLVRQVFVRGLQGIVLTDHHYLWSPGDLAELKRAAEVPEHFLLLAGQELRAAEFGDVLIYGADRPFPAGTTLAEVRRLFPAAALVWAHPYRGSKVPGDKELLDRYFDGVEIFNSNHTARGNSRGLRDWHRLRFTAIGGTDTHGASYAGTYPTSFDHPVRDIHELAREIRKGRCRPLFKEIPKAGGGNVVTEVTIGTKGRDESRERIVIREIETPYKWQAAERGFHIMEAIAAHGFGGGTFRVPRPIDEDAQAMTLIEQGLRGKSLFDKLLVSTVEDGREYVQLAGRWLSKLHASKLRITPPEEFLPKEEQRLARYLKRFTAIEHRYTQKVREIQEAVWEGEMSLVAANPGALVQGHGDYHPKNIFIGQDSLENRATLYVAAIDFESSLMLPPAFDVGCFLAQFRNQFAAYGKILREFGESLFLDAYMEEAGPPGDDFLGGIELFRARTNLSIAAYLVKLGLGDSENLWRVLVEAEKALTLM